MGEGRRQVLENKVLFRSNKRKQPETQIRLGLFVSAMMLRNLQLFS